jgi:hypothetical protein
MARDPMGEFFERMGHVIIEESLVRWYEVQPRVLLSYPYHSLIDPAEEDLEMLMRTRRLRAIRFPTSLSGYGFVSNIAINTDRDYDLPALHQKARNQTRRALETCKIEQIDFDYLREHGIQLNEDTATRQGRESQYADSGYWRKYCDAAKAVNGITAWGSFVDGRLACFLVAIEVDGWAEWVVNHSLTELRNKYPNNALAFLAARHFFQNRGVAGICYGLGSLESTPDLDHFKERMGWRLEPIKQRIFFSPKLRLISKLAGEPVLKGLSTVFPRSYAVRKTSAMLRLYRGQTAGMPPIDGTAGVSGAISPKHEG